MKTTKTKKPDKQVKNRDEKGRFIKGVSGNPKGRPPLGHSITEAIRELMDEKPEIKKALGSKVIELALLGDMKAIRVIWNYLDGLPKQSVDITSAGEKIEGFNYIIPKDDSNNKSDS